MLASCLRLDALIRLGLHKDGPCRLRPITGPAACLYVSREPALRKRWQGVPAWANGLTETRRDETSTRSTRPWALGAGPCFLWQPLMRILANWQGLSARDGPQLHMAELCFCTFLPPTTLEVDWSQLPEAPQNTRVRFYTGLK